MFRMPSASRPTMMVLTLFLVYSLPSRPMAGGQAGNATVFKADMAVSPAAEKAGPQPEFFPLPRTLNRLERHDLGPLSQAERTQLDAIGDREPLRLKVGIAREIDPAVRVANLPEVSPGSAKTHAGGLLLRSASGQLLWTTCFSSQGAIAVRLFIEEAHLPAGTRVVIYGESGEMHGPYTLDSPLPSGGFWTNSVFAEAAFLQVQFPLATAEADVRGHLLTVSKVAHLNEKFAPRPEGRRVSPESISSLSCLVDESCVSASSFANIDLVSKSAAQLTFPVGSDFFVCSGGLLNPTDHSFTPYLLTANHCFSTQASASALEAIWNYKTPSCNAAFPDPSTFPKTLGATLLASDPSSDFTFVRLAQNPPSGSVFLGWTTADNSGSDGTLLYRIAYPGGAPQSFSQHTVTAVPNPVVCSSKPVGLFIYSKNTFGGTDHGSSGSPVFTANGQVVGQLFGSCGLNISDNCDTTDNSTVDGAFRNTYPFIAQWINPAGPAPCVQNATTLCLSNNRFKVTATWQSLSASGVGTAVQLSGDTGYFWFFSSTNLEMVVKVLDACGLNSKKWVFAGGLTNVNVVLTVTDTQTGVAKPYINPQSTAFQPIQDTSAFATCP